MFAQEDEDVIVGALTQIESCQTSETRRGGHASAHGALDRIGLIDSFTLQNCGITDAAVRALIDAYVNFNRVRLQQLRLGGNPFGDDGLTTIVSASAKFRSLRVLQLGDTEVGDAGVAALADAIDQDFWFAQGHQIWLASARHAGGQAAPSVSDEPPARPPSLLVARARIYVYMTIMSLLAARREVVAHLGAAREDLALRALHRLHLRLQRRHLLGEALALAAALGELLLQPVQQPRVALRARLPHGRGRAGRGRAAAAPAAAPSAAATAPAGAASSVGSGARLAPPSATICSRARRRARAPSSGARGAVARPTPGRGAAAPAPAAAAPPSAPTRSASGGGAPHSPLRKERK